MKNTDLHTHSYYSDGKFSPSEVVRMAKKRGIKNLALTDHDSVKGVGEAIREGKKIGVKVIPGVEIRAKGTEVLGYFINYKNKKFLEQIEKSAKNNENATKKWCRTLKKEGYNVDFKEIEKRFPNAKGNLNSFYVIEILHDKKEDRQKFYDKIEKFQPKKTKMPIIEKAIKLIREIGGVAVLAHPWIDKKGFNEKNIKKYVKAGLRGIEIDNGDKNELRTKKVIDKIKRFSEKYNLILTAGSDFHDGEGLGSERRVFGKIKCDEKVIEKLKETIKQ